MKTTEKQSFFALTAWRLGGASVRRTAMTLAVMLLTTMTAWAQDTPEWLRKGDSWDPVTKTLTVNSDMEEAYAENTEIEYVIIKSDTIGVAAFYECSHLKAITIGSGVNYIGEYAFSYCSNLKTVVIMNTEVTKLGGDYGEMFYGTPDDLRIYVPKDKSGNIPDYYINGEWWPIYYKNGMIIGYDWMSGSCAVTIDDGTLTLAGAGAMMKDNDERFNPIDDDITSVVIRDGVSYIGTQAFWGYNNIASVTIPSSVTSIGTQAFCGCNNLEKVTVLRTASVPTLGNYVFDKNDESCPKFYVFSDCVNDYKTAWTDYASDIQPITLTVNEGNDNGDAIDAAATLCDGVNKIDVTLSGRTLYKDGDWNTLCLPFDVTVGSDVMEGATAMTFDGSTSGFDSDGGVLTLNFDDVDEGSTIAAGTPFIVKWTGTNVSDPVFSGVTVSSTTAGSVTSDDKKVQFVGTYSQKDIYSEKHCNLYLGSGNTLYYPEGENMPPFYINACRAYFHVNPDEVEPGGSNVRAFVLNFGDEDEATGILSTTDDTDFTDFDDAWYTLDGRKLSGKPSQRGVYIHGGRKIAVQ